MYVLVFTVLACVGVAAGDDLSFAAPIVFAAAYTKMSLCEIQFPGYPPSAAGSQEYSHCLAQWGRLQGFLAIGAIVAVLALAAVLSVIVPWVDRWRVAHAGHVPDIPGATTRFESLCREVGLTGRRPPRLLIAGPEVRQAFTAALPGGRPLIVIPAAVAVAHSDPSRFDPVVLHELAHVRSRDVAWVSAVRWIAWITIPVIALAQFLGFIAGYTSRSETGWAVLQAAAPVAATVVIAAGLLRRREIEADRLAVQWLGSPEALRRLLDTGGRPTARGGLRGTLRWCLRPLARHPSITARIRALGDPLGLRDGGFWYALAVGVVAVMGMTTSSYLATVFDMGGSALLWEQLSAAAGSILLGFGLTPLLMHMAVRARREGTPCAWWQPVAGTAAGMLLGSLVQLQPAASYSGYAPELALTAHVAVAVLLTACAGAGLTALAAGLASQAARRCPDRWKRSGTAGVALVVSCSAAAVLSPIAYIAGSWGTAPTDVQIWTIFATPADQWLWLALSYPAAVLLLTLRVRLAGVRAPAGTATARWRAVAAGVRDWGRSARMAAAPALTPACAAVAGATIFLPGSYPAAGSPVGLLPRAIEEQAWVCALAGWTVLLVLILAQGVAGLAQAYAAAWLAAFLADAEFFIYAALAGHPHSSVDLSFLITASSEWLLYLAVPTSCLALLRTGPQEAARRWWPVPAAASAAAAAAAVLVAATGIPVLLTPVNLSAAAQAFSSPPVTVPGQPQPDLAALASLPAADPGRVLTYAAAQMVVGAVGTALVAPGPAWVADDAAVTRANNYAIDCGHVWLEKVLGVSPSPVAQASGAYLGGLPPAGNVSLTVQVASFSRLIPSSLRAVPSQDLGQCSRLFTVTGAFTGKKSHSANGVPAPAAGGSAWRADFTGTHRQPGLVVTWTAVTIGHNLVFITQDTFAPHTVPPPDKDAADAALAAAMDALSRAPSTLVPAAAATPEGRAPSARLLAPGSSAMTGTWHGSYFCGVETGLRLVVTSGPDRTLDATFSFYPLRGNPHIPPGSFTMTGTYSADRIYLRPGHWIEEPSGYGMVGMTGAPPADHGRLFTGVITNLNCTTFSLGKS